MNHKTAKIEGISFKLRVVKKFCDTDTAIQQLCDFLYLSHAGIQFGIYNMMCNKGGFVWMKNNVALSFNHRKALFSQTILCGVIAHNRIL